MKGEKHTCLECGKVISFLGKEWHVKKHHNLTLKDYNHKYLSPLPEIFCIICHNPVKVTYSHHYKVIVSECCKSIRKKQNYSNAAKKREEIFKTTIINGKTRKEHIVNSSREKISQILKDKIAKGEFTPCRTNSWANSRIVLTIDGKTKTFRSSWDALFWCLNKEAEYETLRIPYQYNNKTHIYIVDFINHEQRWVCEIKPECYLQDEKVLAKESALKEWCSIHNYKYGIVTNEWFEARAHLITLEMVYDEPKLVKSLKQFQKSLEKFNKLNRDEIVEHILQVYDNYRD